MKVQKVYNTAKQAAVLKMCPEWREACGNIDLRTVGERQERLWAAWLAVDRRYTGKGQNATDAYKVWQSLERFGIAPEKLAFLPKSTKEFLRWHKANLKGPCLFDGSFQPVINVLRRIAEEFNSTVAG